MKKGHRRTQSSYVSCPESSGIRNPTKDKDQSRKIMDLLKESEKKVQKKIINFERLEINSDQQNNYLSFGNYTIDKVNRGGQSAFQGQKQMNLLSIKQKSKSSEMSNKKIVYSKEDEGSRAKKVKERKTSRHEEEKEKNLLGVRGKKIKSLRIK